MYLLFFNFSSHLGCYITLSRVLCAIQQVVVVFRLLVFTFVLRSKFWQCCSVTISCPALSNPMNCSTPGFPVLYHLPEFAQTHVHWVYLILCCHLLPLPSVFPSIRVFSTESAPHIRWPKYWSFSVSPSIEHSRLISFGIDWFDLITVQGILKSLLQHHSLKASILQCSGFCMVQLSHPYMSIGKTIALARWTFVSKVMSLLLICCLGLS